MRPSGGGRSRTMPLRRYRAAVGTNHQLSKPKRLCLGKGRCSLCRIYTVMGRYTTTGDRYRCPASPPAQRGNTAFGSVRGASRVASLRERDADLPIEVSDEQETTAQCARRAHACSSRYQLYTIESRGTRQVYYERLREYIDPHARFTQALRAPSPRYDIPQDWSPPPKAIRQAGRCYGRAVSA